MDFNANKDCISVCETVFESSAEHPIDCDITLPEYLPDIVRILRCTGNSGVQSYQINGDRITAECECLIKVLYICEEGKIRCYDQNIHFSKQIELKPDISADIYVGIKTEYVNYRVSGQRKFEVHGAVSVFAKAKARKKCEFVNAIDGGCVTAKSEVHECCDLISITEKTFPISETVETGTLREPIGAIISQSAVPVIDELKIISNKLFLKGELIINCAFTGQETNEVETLESRVNINQIIESPDVNESCCIDAILSVMSLDIRSRFDSAGDKNLLDVSAALGFSACGYESRKVTQIQDAYSTKYESQIKKSTVYFPFLEEKIDDTFLCRGIADLSSTGMTRVLSFTCQNTTSAFSVSDDGVVIRGEVTADIIYEDANCQIAFAQRQIPFEYKRPLQADGNSLNCKPNCVATASSFTLNEGHKLDVRIEIHAQGFVFSERECNIITEIEIDNSKIKAQKCASLTVYFAECGEALWNIAEKYNTTVDTIMRENHLSANTVEKKCKLLIPRV